MRIASCWLAIVLLAAPAVWGQAASSDDEKLLARNSIAATADGALTYLKALRTDPDRDKQVATWIAQLGDAGYSTRQAAMRELMDLAVVPEVQLRAAAADATNSETSARAKMLLQHPKTAAKLAAVGERRGLTAAVLRMIAAKNIQGAAPLLVELAPQLDADGLALLAGDAAANSTTAADAALLKAAVNGQVKPLASDAAALAHAAATRAIATRGLFTALSSAALPALGELSRDPDPRVSLAAAQSLAEAANRDCLAPLVKLAACEDQAVRVRAVQVLRAATGQTFAENPFLEPTEKEQQAAVAKWQAWLTNQSSAAALRNPLVLQPLAEDLGVGLVLHYAFDSDAKDRITDSAPSARHGETKNACETIDRGRGKALKLIGQGQHGDSGGHAIIPFVDFAGMKQFTVALWVNETAMSHPEGEAYITFGVDRGSGIEDSLGIAHFNDVLLFRVGDGNVSLPYAATDRKRWMHYAMTYRDNKLIAYKDGRELANCAAKVAIVGKNAALGRHWWAGGNGTSARFQGALDEVRIYDRALSSQQLELLVETTK